MKTKRKYITELRKNRFITIVDFNDDKNITKSIKDIRDNGPTTGYLVLTNFKTSKDITSHLKLNESLVLMISKSKLYKILVIHSLSIKTILSAIKQSAYSPKAIIYDSSRGSFLFMVEID